MNDKSIERVDKTLEGKFIRCKCKYTPRTYLVTKVRKKDTLVKPIRTTVCPEDYDYNRKIINFEIVRHYFEIDVDTLMLEEL